MSELFLNVFNLSVSASWLIVAAVIIRILLIKHSPKWILCLLWAVVGLRLILPFSLESDLSLIPSDETINVDAVYGEIAPSETLPNQNLQGNNGASINTSPSDFTSQTPTPEYVDIGIDAIDNRVNQALNERDAESSSQKSGNPLKNIVDVVSIVWVCGMVAMIAYGIVNYLLLKKKVAVSIPDSNGVRRCEAVGSPFILGLFRPRIYLPFGLDEETEFHVIAHERAHLKRCDHLVKPLGYIILTVYWFNPLVWFAYILLCRDIEMACDEKVVKNMNSEARKAYASALLKCGVKHSTIAACPVAFGEIGVKQRVKNAVAYKKPLFIIMLVSVIACISVAVFFLTSPKDESSLSSQDQSAASVPAEGEIDFKSSVLEMSIEGTDKKKYWIISSDQELKEFIDNHEFTVNVYTGNDIFEEYVANLPQGFFDENALLLIPKFFGYMGPETELKRIEIDNGKMTFTVKDCLTQGGNMAIDVKTIVAEFSKSHLNGINEFEIIVEEQGNYYVPHPDYEDDVRIDYEWRLFGGKVEAAQAVQGGTSGFGWLYIMNDSYDVRNFLKKYSYDNEGDDFKDFAEKLDENYFESKTLVGIPCFSLYSGTTFNVSAVRSYVEGIIFNTLSNEAKADGVEKSFNLIVVELGKENIPENAKYHHLVSKRGYDFGKEPYDIEFSVQYFTGCKECSYYRNLVNGNQHYYVLNTVDGLNEFVDFLCGCEEPHELECIDYLKSLDESYFKDKAILAGVVCVDKGEEFNLSRIHAADSNFGWEMTLFFELDDSVTPSVTDPESNDIYVFVAEIDIIESIGCRLTESSVIPMNKD